MSHPQDVTTTDGEVFTYEQTCQMAELVYLRFGKNLTAASQAWSRMMQNDTSPAAFAGLIEEALVYKLINATSAARERRVAALAEAMRLPGETAVVLKA